MMCCDSICGQVYKDEFIVDVIVSINDGVWEGNACASICGMYVVAIQFG